MKNSMRSLSIVSKRKLCTSFYLHTQCQVVRSIRMLYVRRGTVKHS